MTHPSVPLPVWDVPIPWLQTPIRTAGVAQPVISLNSTWKFHAHPPAGYWSRAVGKEAWQDYPVPSCTFSHGLDIPAEQTYAYHRAVAVSPDFAGKRVFLRFDGITGKSQIWIDGRFVRGHYGGYTSWFCEITDLVTPGQEFGLTVGVMDVPMEVSGFNIGGIIRDVHMMAVPAVCISRFHIDAQPTPDFTAADVQVRVEMSPQAEPGCQLHASLVDPAGQTVKLDASSWNPDIGGATAIAQTFALAHPVLWDAEHPRLYTLELRLASPQGEDETVRRRFGIRKVEVAGRTLRVNGREVKLRGVNRHDVHLVTGRTVTAAQVETDIRLFREANINFIRTSHYPPREDMLEFCDAYGIYVAVETAVAFVYQFNHPTQNDPAYTAAYMEQFTEMIERDRDHACVIMWSLANESYWGANFRHQYDYARQADPDRPLIFSYPNTMPEGTPACDIWSLHYANWDRDPSVQTDTWSGYGLETGTVPVLHDEYAHIACYNLSEQRRDPAVRIFWGESIKRWWESIFTTPGALGGAIWGSIDDEMISSTGYTGNREWGIIDGWRRKKPEHWLTQKGYSPIRLQDWTLPDPEPNGEIHVPIANWFDHTNLQEITVEWQVGDASGQMPGPALAPHEKGVLVLPVAMAAGRDSGPVTLRFTREPDLLVDVYRLMPPAAPRPRETRPSDSPALVAYDDHFVIQYHALELSVSRSTGMMTATGAGATIVESGPHLNLTGIPLPPWQASGVEAREHNAGVQIRVHGSYGDVDVVFHILCRDQARLDIEYRILRLPYPPPRARSLRAGRDVGGYREVGVTFELNHSVDRVSWSRRGLWSVYPEDHIGRNHGTAHRERAGGDEGFGVEPAWSWRDDMRNYSLYGRYDVGGRGTHDFRAMKHHIGQAIANSGEDTLGFAAESDFTDAVRLEVLTHPDTVVPVSHPDVTLAGTWIPGEPHSNHEWISNKPGDFVEFRFTGEGICWIGAKDMIYGKAHVFLDGAWQATVDCYSGIGHGTSRGEVKARDEILFSREDLTAGSHVLRLEVLDHKHPDSNNSYVSLSGFRILNRQARGNVLFHILNEWNYPELTWGNYMKDPILIGAGYTNRVQVQIHRP